MHNVAMGRVVAAPRSKMNLVHLMARGHVRYTKTKITHSNTVTQYLLRNVTNAQTLKNGTRNETEVM